MCKGMTVAKSYTVSVILCEALSLSRLKGVPPLGIRPLQGCGAVFTRRREWIDALDGEANKKAYRIWRKKSDIRNYLQTAALGGILGLEMGR